MAVQGAVPVTGQRKPVPMGATDTVQPGMAAAQPVPVSGAPQAGARPPAAQPVPSPAGMSPGVPHQAPAPTPASTAGQVKPKAGQWVPVAGGGYTEYGSRDGYTYNDQGQIYGQNTQGQQPDATYDAGQVLDRAPWMPAPAAAGPGGAGGAPAGYAQGGAPPGVNAGYSDPYTARAEGLSGQAQGIYEQGLQRSGYGTEADNLSQQALRNALGGGADRQKLAMETLRALEDDTEQRSKRNYQDIGRRAAALGGIGQGDVGRQLYEEYGNRERSLANARRDVSLSTSDKQLQDLMDKAGLGQSASSDLYGRDLSRGQFDLSRGDRLAGLGDTQFQRGGSLRTEARGEDQRGINNRVDQVRLEEDLYGNEWQRNRSEIDDLMRYAQGGYDPTQALGDSADQYSGDAARAGATAGGLFDQYGRRKENDEYMDLLQSIYGGGAGASTPGATPPPPAISGKTPNPNAIPVPNYGLPFRPQQPVL